MDCFRRSCFQEIGEQSFINVFISQDTSDNLNNTRWIYTSTDGAVWWVHCAGNNNEISITCGDGMTVEGGFFGDNSIWSTTDDLNSYDIELCDVAWEGSAVSLDPWVHEGFAVYKMAYANGVFLAAGGMGILSADASTTPLSWVPRVASTNDIEFTGLAYGNGTWVAVGHQLPRGSTNYEPLIYRSSAAPPPTQTAPSTANLESIAFAPSNSQHGPLYVAVGQFGAILNSSNGVNWAAVSSPFTNDLHGIAATPEGNFIAVGAAGTTLFSEDGLAWNSALAPVATDLLGVAVSPDGVDLAVGAGGVALFATNFDAANPNWSLGNTGWSGEIKSVTYGAGSFLALGSSGMLLTANNAGPWPDYWPNYGLNGPWMSLVSLSSGGDQFVALNSYGDIIISPDGFNWTVWLSGFGGGAGPLNAVLFNNGLLLAVGDHGVVLNAQFGVSSSAQISDSLSGIAFGNGLYVAVGDDGAILTSTDANSWSQPANYPGTANHLYGVAFGNDRFVGVGAGAWIVTSADGDSWTSAASGVTDADLSGVAFGVGQFVAVGASGVMLTSTDGKQWQVADSGTGRDLDAITWADGRFVVTSDYDAVSLVSTNGTNWILGGAGLGSEVCGVAARDDGLVVAVDSDGDLFSSTDGLNWTQQACDVRLTSVAYGQGLFVAASENGSLLVSGDGTNWMQMPSLADVSLNGITAGNGQFVAVGDAGTTVTAGVALLASLPRGSGWIVADSPGSENLYSVIFGDELFLAVGSDSVVSSDGLSWSMAGTNLAADIEGVAWGNQQFVAVRYDGEVFTSSDGKSWLQPTNLSAYSHAITFGDGVFVAAADSGQVFASSDAVHWSPHTTGLVGDLQAVLYGGGKFVAVASDGTIATSTNGSRWAMQTSPITTALYGIAYGNGLYVAVGDYAVILTSPDAVNWTLQTNSPPTSMGLLSVAWGQGEFMAVGFGGWTLRSNDGTNWIGSSSATVDTLYSVTYANGAFVAVGQDGTIIATPVITRPQLSASWDPGSGVTLTVQGSPSASYNIQTSEDLIHWRPLYELTLPVSQTLKTVSGVFNDLESANSGHCFYRAVILP